MLEEALRYGARGWKVIPLHGIDGKGRCTCGREACEDKGKHPKIRAWKKGATSDENKIREWFDGECANVGIVTGQVSGITVLDIDIGPGKNGAKTWAQLNEEKGEPQTLMARTGSGGMHVFFCYNSALKTSSDTLGDGVDCRNDAGYIVAPPSTHKSGGRYEWIGDDTEALADLPAHLAVRRERRGRKRKDDPTNKQWPLEAVAKMLEFIPSDDRDLWRNVGIILGREFGCSDGAWEAYCTWSETWEGRRARNHDKIMREAFYEFSQESGELSLGTIVALAIDGGWSPTTGSLEKENFLYFAPGNNFIYRPTGAFWPQESVNATVSPVNDEGEIVAPSTWLKKHRLVTSMTNDPAIDNELSKGFDCREGAILETTGAALYNAYRGPIVELGDARLAKPFIEHVRRVFNKPGDAEQFLRYMAHRVQYPGDKPRFSLLIAGQQGIGKDTAISMCTGAIGPWNVANIECKDLDQGFNEYAASVLVVVSEAANHQEMNKWALNERLKLLISGNPDVMTINPKYGQKYSVRLHCGVILTTNHLHGGLYIPADDRRYDVIECATKEEMGLVQDDRRANYFIDLWDWFTEEEGERHIAAYLHEYDLSDFSAATGQRKTEAHASVVMDSMGNDAWLVDALDILDRDDVVRLDVLWTAVEENDADMDRRGFNRQAQYALARAGYARLMNPNAKDGRWKLDCGGKKNWTSIYFNPEKISKKDAISAISELEFKL